MAVVTFETLREIQRREKKSEQLSELKDEFYKGAKEYFERTKNEDLSELRNAQIIFEDVIERREKKIINQALSTVRLREKADIKVMSTKEWEMYESLVSSLKNYREAIDLRGAKIEIKDLTKPQSLSDLIPEKKGNGGEFLKVEVLDELPEIVGTDLKDYGPYKKGDVVSIPRENAQLFISNGKAKEL
ncbi:TPA: DNA replication complex GINS family protein [archaeon]|nr:DNA replication complex GINS family protein [Candidatus Naiadarchaeales archaeon SRR2090153.bin461]HIK02471.1 DNA replication complex GINS family protein [Candidatus Naiadarchaeales archaeon SRR2090159.bin1288]